MEKDVHIYKDNVFDDNGNSVVLYVGKKRDVDKGSYVSANLYTQKDINVDGKSDSPTTMTGLFISMDKVKSDDHVTWYPGSVCDLAPAPDGAECEGDDADSDGDSKSRGDISIDGSLQVYPIPALDEVVIDFISNRESSAEMRLSNTLGGISMQSWHEVKKGSNRVSIDISDLEPGVYSVILKVDRFRYVRKFLKVQTR